jgi:hypothetical protein
MSDAEKAPPRLMHAREDLAGLLRRANRGFAAESDEPEAFRLLEARLAKPSRARRMALVLAFAALGALVLVLLDREPVPLTVTAEPIGGRVERAPPARETGTASIARSTAAPSASSVEARVIPAQPRAKPAPASNTSTPRGNPASLTSSAPLVSEGADCLKLAREGDARAAERCFEARARGSGLSAEYSLYELARLRRDLLEDSSGALAALDQHRARFPRGGLRAEVELTRVELLVKSGRAAEALAEVERMLASGVSREREAELSRIRDALRAPGSSLPRAAPSAAAPAERRTIVPSR